MSLKLFYNIVSPPSRSILILADKLKLNLDKQVVKLTKFENYTEEFKKINPQQSVPVLIENGVALRESRAIMTYLTSKYAPNSSLYPTDLLARQKVDAGLFLDANHILSSFGPLMFTITSEMRKPDQLLIDFVNFNFNKLENVLSENKFIAGDQFTLGDISLITSVTTFQKVELIDFSVYPKIQEWIKRVKPEIINWDEHIEYGGDELRKLVYKLLKMS